MKKLLIEQIRTNLIKDTRPPGAIAKLYDVHRITINRFLRGENEKSPRICIAYIDNHPSFVAEWTQKNIIPNIPKDRAKAMPPTNPNPDRFSPQGKGILNKRV